MAKTIKITCKGASYLTVKALLEFQGNLKTLSEAEYKKLKASIEKYGFSFPMFIWKNGDKHFILDGHQRLHVIQKMLKEGWVIEGGKIPVDFIEAKTKKEAKEKILAVISQYGKLDMESLYEFIKIENLEFSELKTTMEFPAINLSHFEEGYFLPQKDPMDYQKEWGGMPEFDQPSAEAYRSIIVHFDNENDVRNFAKAIGQEITEKSRYLWFPKKPMEKVAHLGYTDKEN